MSQWTAICNTDDLIPDTGICAKLGDYQVAIFKLAISGEVFAIGNYDPIGKANVLSRGLICSLGEGVYVASPLYKQHFDLKTGACLEDEAVSVPVFPVRVEDGSVELNLPSEVSPQQAA